ncbi:ribokinase [Geovibrio thiophilus]|uniref:Ribokinase n=1 Tax=Geovibrio thiophilus TaxID=139438 RepID=A0A410JZ67_9BACT|nr:ribokinase [Geovibrio thiophilus]QAR33486.1 ribokinase [Geovibrio thiophilus]
MSRFCVAGSLNIDLVTRTKRFPKKGETVQGESFSTFTGGKGANQAVALSKLGAETVMTGKLGNDIYAAQYMEYFRKLGISTEGITREETSTGIAVITVDENGENSIIIIPGANGRVSAEYIKEKNELIAKADFLLLQLEVPMEAVLEAAKIANSAGTRIIFDPAPAGDVPSELLKLADIITPNETEAEALTGIRPDDQTGFEAAGKALTAKGVKAAVMKAGSRGAYIYQNGRLIHAEGFKVNTVDTTAAGDTFNAGLAYALGEGMALRAAVRFANAAAAISTTKHGAQDGMPSLNEVQGLLEG